MKNLLLLTLCLVILTFSSGMAGEVTKKDAQKAAINAYYEKVNQYDRALSFGDVIISDEYTRYHNGVPVFYAFDFATGGFVIISAEDAMDPILGYSFEREFPKGEHAYVYRSFLDSYVDQINFIRENQIGAEEAIAAEWDYLLTSDASQLNTTKDPKDVEPLVTSMWNQDYPYNIMCPEDPGGSGGHVFVGCVATTMSIIMHYWNYPIHGDHDHCYTPPDPSYGQQCADFENTYYQWTGMTDQIDNMNPWPIAELGYHAAVSVNMDFGPDGSGSFSYLVANRLAYFWTYDDAEYHEKENYSMTVWYNMLNADIDQGYPVYYSGYSNTGAGHAFVCDGYQGTDYHFNFGWSGSGNGYYSLYDVGGYNQGQQIVNNFYPTDPAYPYYATGQTVITDMSGQFSDGSGPVEDYLPNTDASWLIDPQTATDSVEDISISFISFDLGAGDMLRIYDGETTSAPMLGEFTGTTIPGNLTSTANKMLITLISDGSTEGAGFKAEFEANRPAFCGMVNYTEPMGTITDGSGDFYYNPGTTCFYVIDPPYATDMLITFNSFDTEEGNDILKVYDGDNNVLGEFSGDDIPGPIQVPTGSATLKFTSSKFDQAQGWEIYYEIGNVGVDEEEAFAELQVFPNPASDALNVNFNLRQNQNVEMRLVNVTGEAVYTHQLSNVSGSVSHRIDVSNLAKGIYILNLTSAEGSTNKKVIIK